MIKNPDWDMREDIEYLSHQLEGIDLLVERRRQILADDPGAGKSLQCLAACKELSAKRILVVSVSGSVRDTWPTEISKHTKGGVEMIFQLEPFTKEAFEDIVNDFDVDDQIQYYWNDPKYKENFTIRQSLKDFEDFKNQLEELNQKLNR